MLANGEVRPNMMCKLTLLVLAVAATARHFSPGPPNLQMGQSTSQVCQQNRVIILQFLIKIKKLLRNRFFGMCLKNVDF